MDVSWGDVIKLGCEAIFIWLGVQGLKAKAEILTGKISSTTASPTQVGRVETKVDTANDELNAIKEKVKEIERHLGINPPFKNEKQSDYIPIDPKKK